MTRRKLAFFVITAGVTATIAVAWAAGWFGSREFSSDPEVAEVERLRKQVFSELENNSAEEGPDVSDELFRSYQELSPEQQQQFAASGRELMDQALIEQLQGFFELPPDEQQQELDDQIDQIIAGRKALGRRVSPGNRPARRNTRFTSREQVAQNKRQALDRTPPELRGLEAA